MVLIMTSHLGEDSRGISPGFKTTKPLKSKARPKSKEKENGQNPGCYIKELNYDLKLAGEKRLFDISSLDEWRTQAYENAKLFKEKVKRWHDKRIQKRVFN